MRRLILILLIATLFLAPLLIVPLSIDYYNPPKELFVQIIIVLCLALWLINAIKEKRFEIVKSPIYFSLVLYCLFCGLSLIWAKSFYSGLRAWIPIITYLAAFFVCVNTVNQKEIGVVAQAVFASGIIAVLYAIFQYFGFDFIKYPSVDFPDWRFKLYSSFGNPDFLANYIILVFPAGLGMYLATQRLIKKMSLLFGLSILFTGLLITFSLGAIAGFTVSIAVMVLFIASDLHKMKKFRCFKKPVRHIGISLAALFIIFGLLAAFFFVESSLHSPSILNKAVASKAWRHGFKNRLMLYRTAYKMIKDNPLIGVGIGNFKFRFPEYRARLLEAGHQYADSRILDKERDKNVLNEYLQVFAETGAIGFLIFIVIIISIFNAGLFAYEALMDERRRLVVLGILIGVGAFLIHSFVSFPLHVVPNALTFWTFAALLFTQPARVNRIVVSLNLGQLQKRALRTGFVIIGLTLAVWPIRFYLSDVFLRRMVEFDKKGLIEEALTEARTSLFFDPNSNAIIYAGNFAVLNNDYKTAGACFKKALENNDEINYHIALAEAYKRENLPQDCISEYLKAILLNPFYADGRLKLAEFYMANRMYNEAEGECQFILINNPDNIAVKKKANNIMGKIFSKRLLKIYHGEVRPKE